MLIRRWLAAGFCVGLALVPVGLLAGSASAATQGYSLTVSNSSPDVGDTVTISATTPCTTTLGLCGGTYPAKSVTLTDPQGCVFTIGTTSTTKGTFTADFDTATDEVGSASVQSFLAGGATCGVDESGAFASAGTWSVAMSGASSTTIAVQPPTPTGLTVLAGADGVKAFLSWTGVAIPDLIGYVVYDDDGGSPVAVGTATPSTYCAASQTCTYAVTYAAAIASGSHSLSVATETDPDSSPADQLISAAATPVNVTLVGPPAPTPTPTSTSGTNPGGGKSGTGGNSPTTTSSSGTGAGSTGGGKGGTSGGGNTTTSNSSASNKAGDSAAQKVAVGFSNFAPSTGIPALPPLPNLADNNSSTTTVGSGGTVTASGEPTDPGTYSPTLTYPNATTTQKVTTSKGAAAIYDDVTANVTPTQLFRSIAAALLMLLAAGHVRLWLRRHSREEY